jgi:hypothetical protein
MMKESEGNRRYRLELGAAMLLYIAVLFVAVRYGKPMGAGWPRTLLLAAPIVPMLLAVWAIARHFRRMDEFLRLRGLESLALSAAVTAVVTFSYGFLETAGFPKVSMFWVWPIMGGVWALHSSLRCVLSR